MHNLLQNNQSQNKVKFLTHKKLQLSDKGKTWKKQQNKETKTKKHCSGRKLGLKIFKKIDLFGKSKQMISHNDFNNALVKWKLWCKNNF